MGHDRRVNLWSVLTDAERSKGSKCLSDFALLVHTVVDYNGIPRSRAWPPKECRRNDMIDSQGTE